MNRLIKEGANSSSSLYNLHDQTQRLLDDKAKWAWHNTYLYSLPINQALSIIDPIFSNINKLMKRYLISHILSVQHQQIFESLL